MKKEHIRLKEWRQMGIGFLYQRQGRTRQERTGQGEETEHTRDEEGQCRRCVECAN